MSGSIHTLSEVRSAKNVYVAMQQFLCGRQYFYPSHRLFCLLSVALSYSHKIIVIYENVLIIYENISIPNLLRSLEIFILYMIAEISFHRFQIKLPEDYKLWLQTMGAEFPERFKRLFAGPMWSGMKKEDVGKPDKV